MHTVAVKDAGLPELFRERDRLTFGQASSEPITLTRRIVDEAERLPDISVFLGNVSSGTFRPEVSPKISFESYGAIGDVAALVEADRVALFPMHYSALNVAIAQGLLRFDCVMLQVAPALSGRGFNLGLARDYAVLAARHARNVVLEVNPLVPRCHGGDLGDDFRFSVAVEAEEPPFEQTMTLPSETDQRIASNVAGLIPDKAVLQIGIGSLPHAVMQALRGHKDLGFHSGVMTDSVLDLIEAGVLTNAAKEHDAGVSLAGLLTGTRRLFDFANNNLAFRLSGAEKTHDLGTIAALSRFCAVNSAVEVDLSGQVNSERAGGRYVGAVGGQVDFIRGANLSPGGRAIIALPATARAGSISRIVSQVSTVTCARSDVDAIVTEYGVAELRGAKLDERAARMIAIAAPQFREELERSWHETRKVADD